MPPSSPASVDKMKVPWPKPAIGPIDHVLPPPASARPPPRPEIGDHPMSRTDRLTGIIVALQGGRHTAAQLAQRFEVSRRTILRDIDALGGIGVPIVAIPGVGGGYSLADGFWLPPLHFSGSETAVLILALRSLGDSAASPSATPTAASRPNFGPPSDPPSWPRPPENSTPWTSPHLAAPPTRPTSPFCATPPAASGGSASSTAPFAASPPTASSPAKSPPRTANGT